MRNRGARYLAGILLAVLLFWGSVFPRLSQRGDFQRKQAERNRQGVHLHAMFYTELEVLEKHTALHRLREESPWALWLPWAHASNSPADAVTD